MTRAVYPGSFDPITMGHVDIIRRVQPVFDELTVLVSKSSDKNYLFGIDERMELIEESLGHTSGVRVDSYEGLTVDYLRQNGQQVIIRGIRAVTDFEYELVMANMNKKMASDIETMIVFANPDYHYVASRVIKEVASHGGPLEDFVPVAVQKALVKKFQKTTS